MPDEVVSGKVTILQDLGYDTHARQRRYLVRCECCGRELIIRKDQLGSMSKRGCPLCRQVISSDLTGIRIKTFIVTDPVPDSSGALWNCECEVCGAKAVFRRHHIKNGKVRDCECERRKKFLATRNIDEAMLKSLFF